jgi:hypothetical protein
MLFSNMLAAIRVRSSRISALRFELCATLPAIIVAEGQLASREET